MSNIFGSDLKLEQVHVWRTSDGRTFDMSEKEAASQHQLLLSTAQVLEDLDLYWGDPSPRATAQALLDRNLVVIKKTLLDDYLLMIGSARGLALLADLKVEGSR